MESSGWSWLKVFKLKTFPKQNLASVAILGEKLADRIKTIFLKKIIYRSPKQML